MALERGRLTPPEVVADALLTREALLHGLWAMSNDGHVSLAAIDKYFKRSLGELSLAQMMALSHDGDVPFQRITESGDRLRSPEHTLFPNSRLGGSNG